MKPLPALMRAISRGTQIVLAWVFGDDAAPKEQQRRWPPAGTIVVGTTRATRKERRDAGGRDRVSGRRLGLGL